MSEEGGHNKIISYLCQTWTPAEENYSASERECLTIAHASNVLKLFP
jgi:hypothetical protein